MELDDVTNPQALIASLEYVEREGGAVKENYFAWFVINKSGLGHSRFGKWMTEAGREGFFDRGGDLVVITPRGTQRLEAERARKKEAARTTPRGTADMTKKPKRNSFLDGYKTYDPQ